MQNIRLCGIRMQGGSACSLRTWSLLCALCVHRFHGSFAERKLKLVTVVYRHGDRSPTESFPTDSHKEDAWPQGFGQLTEIGMQQHYELGQYLKKRYVGFLNGSYDHNEVYVRSTDYDRTIMSAQANLAGMYPPTGAQTWNPKIPWQPIPVHTVPLSEEQLLVYPFENCPRFKELTKETLSSTEFQNLIQPHKDFINNMSRDTGYTVGSLIGHGKLWVAYDTLLCEDIHNLTLPTWATTETRTKLKALSQLLLRGLFDIYKQDEKSRLQGGVLVGAILKNFTDFTKTPSSKQKMIIYSAHDTTIMAVQVALNVFNDQLPPYAVCTFFELHQEDDGQYSIDMYYRNDTGSDPHPLFLPGCHSPCLLQQFTELVSPIIAKDRMKECGITDKNTDIITGLAFALSLMVLLCIMLVFILCRKRVQRNNYQEI